MKCHVYTLILQAPSLPIERSRFIGEKQVELAKSRSAGPQDCFCKIQVKTFFLKYKGKRGGLPLISSRNAGDSRNYILTYSF